METPAQPENTGLSIDECIKQKTFELTLAASFLEKPLRCTKSAPAPVFKCVFSKKNTNNHQ